MGFNSGFKGLNKRETGHFEIFEVEKSGKTLRLLGIAYLQDI